MTNPCIEYCYLRHGRRYTSDCDATCEFAKAVKENRTLRADIEQLTSAGHDKDAVRVVRCKNCSHRGSRLDKDGSVHIACYKMNDDDFCSYGK